MHAIVTAWAVAAAAPSPNCQPFKRRRKIMVKRSAPLAKLMERKAINRTSHKMQVAVITCGCVIAFVVILIQICVAP
jgi:hypothetical protein